MNQLEEGSVSDLVDYLTFCTATVDAPEWFIHPIFKQVLGSEEVFHELCTKISVEYAPGLHEVLLSSTPPSLDFFCSLPVVSPGQKVWAVYTLLYEKPGYPMKLYIGSGTQGTDGVAVRFSGYDSPTGRALPSGVKDAVQDGYTLCHRGLLCWAQVPSAGQAPKARVRFVAIEAVFTFLFFAAVETRLDVHWSSLFTWAREDVSWLPLCSHISLIERP